MFCKMVRGVRGGCGGEKNVEIQSLGVGRECPYLQVLDQCSKRVCVMQALEKAFCAPNNRVPHTDKPLGPEARVEDVEAVQVF